MQWEKATVSQRSKIRRYDQLGKNQGSLSMEDGENARNLGGWKGRLGYEWIMNAARNHKIIKIREATK